ncbi:MAG: DUF4423 domain-containing protein [Myxococcales bacterium]|nr:DUF4423 domain-containing protein [Myxococcales bacterium]
MRHDPSRARWIAASSELLRALRGSRSQLAFSRRLGFRSNVACDWEAGRRFPTAQQTLLACRRCGVDLARAFSAFQAACAPLLFSAEPLAIDRWLDALRGRATLAALSQRAGCSRYAVARCLSGQTAPRLPDFLQLVDAITGRVSDLVDLLVPIEQVPSLYPAHLQRAAARRLAFDTPWTEAVLRVMETEDYRNALTHRPGYIARRLGITIEQEAEALEALTQAGVLKRSGDCFQSTEPLTVDTAGAEGELNRLKMHWSRAALERLEQPRPEDWLGYNVISTSAADLERIREILRGAFREIRSVAGSSKPVESVALLNLQLVTWNQ